MKILNSFGNFSYSNYFFKILILVLSQNRYFQDKAFIKYLEYLLYWKKPEYCKFIIYPHCLRFLDLLQQPAFRQRLSDLEYIQLIFSQQYFHWRYYRSNRLGIF